MVRPLKLRSTHIRFGFHSSRLQPWASRSSTCRRTIASRIILYYECSQGWRETV